MESYKVKVMGRIEKRRATVNNKVEKQVVKIEEKNRGEERRCGEWEQGKGMSISM